MRNFTVTNLAIGALGLMALGNASLSPAVAHEGHKMECSASHVKAMNADVQAMRAGEAKTTAIKEMRTAQDMMAKKDTQGCMDHLHKAAEAMEK